MCEETYLVTNVSEQYEMVVFKFLENIISAISGVLNVHKCIDACYAKFPSSPN